METILACKNCDGSTTTESSNTHNKYDQIIATLPRENGWKMFDYVAKYQGFWFPSVLMKNIMSVQENFTPLPNDIVLSTSPKSGTTWLKALGFAIATRNHFDDLSNPLLKALPHDLLHCLEFVPEFYDPSNRDPQIPLLATHLPYSCLPKSIIDSGCKIVYLCRDPKDSFISLWQFVCKATGVSLESFPLEEAFEIYTKGASPFGSYWDHVLGYWKASLEHPDRVLFLKYEDLKNDTPFYAKKMAEFMGRPFSTEEEKQGAVEKIINLCSFENLSTLQVNKSGTYRPADLPTTANNKFFRKGKVGDWKNYFTDEVTKRFEQITKEKFSGSGLI